MGVLAADTLSVLWMHAHLHLLLGEGVWYTTDEIEMIDGWVRAAFFLLQIKLLTALCAGWAREVVGFSRYKCQNENFSSVRVGTPFSAFCEVTLVWRSVR